MESQCTTKGHTLSRRLLSGLQSNGLVTGDAAKSKRFVHTGSIITQNFLLSRSLGCLELCESLLCVEVMHTQRKRKWNVDLIHCQQQKKLQNPLTKERKQLLCQHSLQEVQCDHNLNNMDHRWLMKKEGERGLHNYHALLAWK